MYSELTIFGLMMILKRRRLVILWTICICLVLGLLVSAFLDPRYRATGEIEIQKSATDGLGLDNLAGQSDGPSDALDTNITLQTQAKILESDNLALRVIEDLQLEQTKDFKSSFSPIGWIINLFSTDVPQDPTAAPLAAAPRRREHALKVFEKNLKIKQQAGTRLIDIQYTSSSPSTAADVVNDVAKSLVDYTLNSRYTATNQISTWLTGQLGDIKQEAENRQAKVEQLQRESGVYSLGLTDAQGKEIAYSATLDRLQQATQALAAATSNRILKGGLYKTVQNGDPELISGLAGSALAGSTPAVNNDFQLLQTLRGEQARLSSQFAADKSKYGTANPKLLDEREGLSSIDQQISDEISRIGKRALNDYKAAQTVEENSRAVYEEERRSANTLNDKSIALLIARQEATDARSLYQTLYSHLKEAGVIEGLRSSNVSVVTTGLKPSKPLPDVLICMALSLALGCFVGVCSALLLEATSDLVEGSAEIESSLHVRVLATLPVTDTSPILESPKSQLQSLRHRISAGVQTPESAKNTVLQKPNTAYVEAMRVLRTSLIFPRNGRQIKTILVTSAADREGKSTLCLNLTAVLALNGSRVLLIDGDMRGAGLTRYLGYERQEHLPLGGTMSGLSDALSGVEPPRLITPFPELPALSALAAGSPSPSTSELLGSAKMKRLMEGWAAEYDYVVIDSPPVLAVADALVISRLADTVLVVVRDNWTTKTNLHNAYHLLQSIGVADVDLVLNGIRRNSSSSNNLYGYTGKVHYSEA